jgi:hypothetical protein
MTPANDEAAGIALTEEIMGVVLPILNGKPTDLAIEALAAAFVSSLAGGVTDERGARIVLHRFAERILDFAQLLQ